MTFASSSVSSQTLTLIAILVVVVATIATLLFNVPGAEQAFDITPDPAGGLWAW